MAERCWAWKPGLAGGAAANPLSAMADERPVGGDTGCCGAGDEVLIANGGAKAGALTGDGAGCGAASDEVLAGIGGGNPEALTEDGAGCSAASDGAGCGGSARLLAASTSGASHVDPSAESCQAAGIGMLAERASGVGRESCRLRASGGGGSERPSAHCSVATASDSRTLPSSESSSGSADPHMCC